MGYFKYCNSFGKLIIENLEIKVALPNELDGERDVIPVVTNSDPQSWAERQLDEMLADQSIFESNDISKGHTFAEFKNFANSCRAIVIAGIAGASSKTGDHLRKEWLNLHSKRWGLVSLTTSPCVNSMWNQYADAHNGLVVEIDTEKILSDKHIFVKCKYCDIPVTLDIAKKEHDEGIAQIVRRKKTNFSFEAERRLIVPLAECRPSSGLNLYRLDACAIVSVTFGIVTPDVFKKDVIALLTRPELVHVTKWQIESVDDGVVNMKRTQLP